MRLELYGGPWSKSYCSSFVKWKKKYALKVRNDTEMILGGRGGGAVHVFTLLSTSLQWPLSSVPKVAVEETFNCTYWRINFCMQLIAVSSSVLVLKTDYTCNICLRFEHGLSWNHSPRKEIWIKLCRVTRPKHSLHFFPFTFTICILHFAYLHCYYILGYLAKLPY